MNDHAIQRPVPRYSASKCPSIALLGMCGVHAGEGLELDAEAGHPNLL